MTKKNFNDKRAIQVATGQALTEKKILSGRARGVLLEVVARAASKEPLAPVLPTKLSDSELLRRVSKIEPPVSFANLVARAKGCGKQTAREICLTLGLPVPDEERGRVQCPQCGHIF